MTPTRPDLRSFSLEDMEKLFSQKFRAAQVFAWIHQKGVSSFDEMSNLSKELRADLASKFDILTLKKLKEQKSKDGTKKYLWELSDGSKVESVLLLDKERKTICLSTQVGCKLNCTMCATAKIKFKRNLSAGEILSQVLQIENEQGRISNIVYMGMGEPLDNYDNVLKSARILNHAKGKNIGQRKITISTCGMIPQIKQFAKEKLQVRLAISLNSSRDVIRNEIMPINKRFNIKDLITAVKEYESATNRRTMFEYVLIDELNDTEDDAKALASLLKGMKVNVNLIEFNPFSGALYKPSSRAKIQKFKKILQNAKIEVGQRFKRGQDIDGACGQLTGKYREDKN